MKRKYVQPKVDIVNLTSTTSFLESSPVQTEGTADDNLIKDGSGDDFIDDGNTPADPWA